MVGAPPAFAVSPKVHWGPGFNRTTTTPPIASNKSLHPLILAIVACMPSIAAAQVITVEPPIRVSPPDSGGHFWGMGNTQAAPDDPASLITCGVRIRTNPLSWEGYLYASADGGRTWQATHIDATPSDGGVPNKVSEVSCAIGRHGTMYMNTSIWGKFFSQPFQLTHSTDGGHTWSKPLQRSGWYDATRSVVDNSGGPFDRSLYIFSNRWHFSTSVAGFNSSYEPLLVSTNGGRTLQAATASVPASRYFDPGWPSQAVVLNDGTAIAVHRVEFIASDVDKQGSAPGQMTENLGVEILKSKDRGRSLDAPVTISRWRRYWSRGITGLREQDGIFNLITAVAVDRSPGVFKNRIYVAWRQADDADPVSRIMLAWSQDSGTTWSKPIRVDDAPKDRAGNRSSDPMVPSLAVNKDGVLGLFWTEGMGTPHWRFAASIDGGATFLPSVAVYSAHESEEPVPTRWLNNYISAADQPVDWDHGFSPQFDKVGFTLYTQFNAICALAATADGVFHPTWNTKVDGALWTARVEVNHAALPPSALNIAGLIDVSKIVRLEPHDFHYDPDSARVSVDVVLVNTSVPVPDRDDPRLRISKGQELLSAQPEISLQDRPLIAPLILRVSATQSEIGQLHLVNFDGIDSTGASLVDWSKALPAGGLAPGTRSSALRLEFGLTQLKPSRDVDVLRLVNFSAQAFSK
jgi:hypothetical protein